MVILKKKVDESETSKIIDEKKTSVFKSRLKKPKKESVQVDTITLFYEAMLKVSGIYVADYFRKKVHTISVDSNVQEIVFGGGTFPIKKKSGFKKALVGSRGKNKIDLPLEEHVFVENEKEMVFDYHGNEIRFPFKINSKTIENYVNKILNDESTNLKKLKLSYSSAIKQLKESLKQQLESDIRKLNEDFDLKEITLIYVPVYEARLIGPKGKVGLLRLDAVRKKIL